MDQIIELLQSFELRLAAIERALTIRPLDEIVSRSNYSCDEVAKLTEQYGIKAASRYTVRQACNDGRIPDPEKNESGHWRIPREAVLRVLEEGIPPERRASRSHVNGSPRSRSSS